jgi:hypothetical protein
MFEVAQQLSYYLRVVDGGATSKLVSFGQQLASVGMIASSVRQSLQTALAPMQSVATAWSGREQQLNSMSRTLRQYEIVGTSIAEINERINRSMVNSTVSERAAAQTAAYRQQFTDARQFSRGIIQQMSEDAAILPGELNDYAASFASFLPAAMGSATRRVNGHLQTRTVGEILRTSNYLTAGGVSAGIDAPQVSRDIMGMMQGVAGLDNRTWREVVKNYATFRGRRITDAGQFNRLTGDQRFEVLADVASRLQPLMDATGDAYEAIIGTFVSLRHELFLSITEPVYNAWKGIISATTVQMARLAPIVERISGRLLQPVTRWMERFAQVMPKVGEKLEQWLTALPEKMSQVSTRAWAMYSAGKTHMNEMLRGFFASHPAFGSRRSSVNGTMAAVLGVPLATLVTDLGSAAKTFFLQALPLLLMRSLGVALGPVGIFLTVLLGRVFGMGAFGGASGTGIVAFIGQLVTAFAPLVLMLDAFMNVLAVGVSTVLPVLFTTLQLLGGVVTGVLLPIFTVFQVLVYGAAAILVVALFGLAVAFNILWEVVKATARILLTGFSYMGFLTGPLRNLNLDITNFAETMRQLSMNLRNWWTELGESVQYLKLQLHLISAEEYQRNLRSREEVRLSRAFDETEAGLAEIQRRTSTFNPNRRGRPEANRPQVHQDFRYSRFDITQKFAEGFSPERVAAAFVGDLESMASQRLSSGFAPAFSNG